MRENLSHKPPEFRALFVTHPSILKTSKTEPPQKLCLDTSPLEWSVTDVVRFIRTTDCAPLARIFMDQVRNSKDSISIWNCIMLIVSDVISQNENVTYAFTSDRTDFFFFSVAAVLRRLMGKHCYC